MVHADVQILVSALSNLVQNACKFTPSPGQVTLKTRTTVDRVQIDIEDECGGLPPGTIKDLFRMFEQRSSDRTGLGLGLAISRRGIEDSGGTMHVPTWRARDASSRSICRDRRTCSIRRILRQPCGDRASSALADTAW